MILLSIIFDLPLCLISNNQKQIKMTTLNFKRQDGCEKVYLNPLDKETAEGDVLKVVVLINNDNSIHSYDITYREGHFYMGNRTESTILLPENIILQD